jgi:hypothetical protein
MSRRRPSFVGLFHRHVRVGVWVTGRELARRISSFSGEFLCESELSPLAKECSQRLSNLERYGHVLRRYNPSVNAFEYARKETPQVKKSTWFPSHPNHETIE